MSHLNVRFREAVCYELLHRASNILDRHLRVNAVLIKEIHAVGPEPLERGVGHLPDALRPAILAAC